MNNENLYTHPLLKGYPPVHAPCPTERISEHEFRLKPDQRYVRFCDEVLSYVDALRERSFSDDDAFDELLHIFAPEPGVFAFRASSDIENISVPPGSLAFYFSLSLSCGDEQDPEEFLLVNEMGVNTPPPDTPFHRLDYYSEDCIVEDYMFVTGGLVPIFLKYYRLGPVDVSVVPDPLPE